MRITPDTLFASMVPLRVYAQRAGEILMRHFNSGSTQAWQKADRSLVTAADIESENFLLEKLRETFPDTPVVAEESVGNGHRPDLSGGTFITLDPLDGTSDFLQRRPGFVVAQGVVIDGKAVAGVVHHPLTGVTYYAAEGQAFRIDAKGTHPITVRQTADLPRVLLNELHGDHALVFDLYSRLFGGSATTQAFQENTQDVCTLDPQSGVFRFCQVAEGQADLFAFATHHQGRVTGGGWWDTAPGQAIVEAAGGVVTDFNGRALRYDPGSSDNFQSPAYVMAGDERLISPLRKERALTGTLPTKKTLRR